jgi:hypothetical protein
MAGKRGRSGRKKKTQPKKEVETSQPVEVKQPEPGRDETGKFAPGNPFGFQPGQSGNPAGRPKIRTLTEAYRKYLAEPHPDYAGLSRAEVIAMRQCAIAESDDKGSTNAAKEMADRTEGKPRQSVEIHDPNFKAKQEYYERLIEAITRTASQSNLTYSRMEVIERIATYKPEILSFLDH